MVTEMSKSERGERLKRILGRAGAVPGARVEQYVHSKRITVNGEIVIDPDLRIPAPGAIAIDGEPAQLAWRTRVLAYHKPAGLIVAGHDPEGVGTVFDALRAALPPDLARFAWHAVGRLDRDTTGLILFTNDERLVEHATSPEVHLAKRYVAQVDGRLTEETLAPIRAGLVLHDGPTRPAHARVRGPGEVEVTLTEGRNRQVRRMLDAVRLGVRSLRREAIGALSIDVPEGGWRELSDDEVLASLAFEPRAS